MGKFVVNSEVAVSCTAGIFIWDMVHFNCDSLNNEVQFIEQQ